MKKRKKCSIDHSRCSWKCSLEDKDNQGNDIYVSKNFEILYHGDRVSLNSGAIFQISVDDVSEPKGGIEASNQECDYQDIHLEFSLGFSSDYE